MNAWSFDGSGMSSLPKMSVELMGVGGRAGRGIVESQDDHLTQEGEEKTRMLSDFVCEFHNRTRDHAPGQGKIERHVLQSIVRRTEACRVTGGPNPTLDWFRPLFYACHDTMIPSQLILYLAISNR